LGGCGRRAGGLLAFKLCLATFSYEPAAISLSEKAFVTA